MERTLSIIKPDAVERNLTKEIISFLENKNLKVITSKKIQITKEEAEDFYKVHQSKPFYERLCNYLSSGPIVVIILEGDKAVENYRKIMGSTDPKQAEKNTLRNSNSLKLSWNEKYSAY